MILNVLLQLFITVIISLGIGYILSDFIGMLKGFAAGIVLQFIIRYIIDVFKTKPTSSNIEEESILQDVIDAQTVPITCPCGNNTFYTPIFLNKDNIFQCEKCSSKFRAEATIDTILLTEPINLQNAFDYLKQKEL